MGFGTGHGLREACARTSPPVREARWKRIALGIACAALAAGCPGTPAPREPQGPPAGEDVLAVAGADAAPAPSEAETSAEPSPRMGPLFAWAGEMTVLAGAFTAVDPAADRVLPVLLPQIRGDSGTITDWRLAVSPDGSLVAGVDGWTARALVWEARTGRLRSTLSGTGGAALAVAFTAGGDAIVTAAASGAVRTWDLATGKLRSSFHSLDCDEGETCPSRHLPRFFLTADGTKVAVQNFAEPVRIFDVASGRRLATFPAPRAPVGAVRFSPDGSLLAVGMPDGTVELHDANTGELGAALEGSPPRPGERFQDASVFALAFSSDGTLLASGGGSGLVHVWDLATGGLRHTLQVCPPDLVVGDDEQDGVFGLAFSPDGRMLAAGASLGRLRVYDVASGTLRWSVDLARLFEEAEGAEPGTYVADSELLVDPLRDLFFSPDGRTLAAGPDFGVWDAASGERRGPSSLSASVALAGFAAGGTSVVGFEQRESCLAGFDPASGATTSCFPLVVEGHPDVDFAAWVDGGRRAVVLLDASRKWWNLAPDAVREGEAPCGLEGEAAGLPVAQEVFAAGPAGRTIATGYRSPIGRTMDGFVLCDLATNQARVRRLAGMGARLLDLSFDSDERTLAALYDLSYGAGAALRLWRVDSLDAATELTERRGRWLAAAIRPDGSRVAVVTAEGRLLEWDAETGEAQDTFDATGGGVVSVRGEHSPALLAWNPAGTILAVAGSERSVELWDAVSGERRAILSEHADAVTALAFSPDGRFLASVGADGLLAVWDTAAATLRAAVWSDSPMEAVAWRPDGGVILAGGRLGLDLLRAGDGARLRIRRLRVPPERHTRLLWTDGGLWDADDPAAAAPALAMAPGPGTEGNPEAATEDGAVERCRRPGLLDEFLQGRSVRCPATEARP